MKMKRALALSLLALGAVGVSACKKDDETNDNNQNEVDVVANKKAAAKAELDSYVTGLLEGAGIDSFASLETIVTAQKADIDAKDTEAAIESVVASAKTAVLAEINNNKNEIIARKNAKQELASYIAVKKFGAGYDSAATAFDKVKSDAEKAIDAAKTKTEIKAALEAAKTAAQNVANDKKVADLTSAVAAAKTNISAYATQKLTDGGVTDTGEKVAAIVTALGESVDKATFVKEVDLLVSAAKSDIDFQVNNLIMTDLADERTTAATAYDTYVTDNIGTKTDDGTVAAKVAQLKAELNSYMTAADITAAVEAGKTAIKAAIDAIMTAEQIAEFKTAKKAALVAYATSLGFTDAIPGYADNMATMNGWIDSENVKLNIEQAFIKAKKAIYDGTEDYVNELTYIEIATVQDFLDMQAELVAAESISDATEKAAALAKNYKLTADIDMKDVKATAGSNIQGYTGTFDGNGFAIKNYNVVDATTGKVGLLFRSTKNATIKNVTFINCSHIGTQEGIALLVGDAETTTFKNLEFNGCTVDAGSKSYAGLLIGRNTRNGVTVDGITVKGNSYTSANYGGGLIGDARDIGTGTATFKNLNIDLNMNVYGNTGGLLIGRTKAAGTYVVENAVINTNITGNSTKASALFDGASSVPCTLKNVIISGSTRDKVTSDIVAGNGKITPTMTNVYVVSDATDAKYNTYADVKTVESAGLTEEFMLTTLGFGDAWVFEDGKARLHYASSDVIPADATVESLSVITTLAKTRYKIGEAFDKNGLTVTAKYLLPNGTTVDKTLQSYEYEISCPTFNNKVAGTYNVEVSFGSVKTSYDVSVVEIESIEVVTNEASQVFTDVNSFKADGLVVKTIYSDGAVEKLDDDKYEIDLSLLDSDKGGYVVIKTGENGNSFSDSYAINILDKIVLESAAKKISVNVDSLATTATVEDGYAVFTTIKDALDYLEALNLNASVEKVVNIAAGTYEEKIVVNDDNVTFVGEADKDGNALVDITFGMAAGHNTFDLAGTWGTDKSATVLVYGDSFSAKNIAFTNTFDYFNDKTAGSNTQALAIGVYADQATFYQCEFRGYQDTVQTKNGRQYFYDCYIAGCVDYIFGVNCTTFFEGCEIESLDRHVTNNNNGYVVAPKTDAAYTYGFYFNNCEFTAEETVKDGTMALARPWGATGTCVIMNSKISKAYSTAAYGNEEKDQPRYADMSGNKPANANFLEFNNTGDGAISEAVTGMKMATVEQVVKYTVAKLFAAGEGTGVTYTAWDAAADLNALK